jgi:hypothetical protein
MYEVEDVWKGILFIIHSALERRDKELRRRLRNVEV